LSDLEIPWVYFSLRSEYVQVRHKKNDLIFANGDLGRSQMAGR